ncbi:hypothetical protein XCR_4028 [Xanthomonas campestris pv. raphani 756C]|nr:hypothetical protein XCR_4028 [Xanthomonas campestris pv. raphani 756C]
MVLNKRQPRLCLCQALARAIERASQPQVDNDAPVQRPSSRPRCRR